MQVCHVGVGTDHKFLVIIIRNLLPLGRMLRKADSDYGRQIALQKLENLKHYIGQRKCLFIVCFQKFTVGHTPPR